MVDALNNLARAPEDGFVTGSGSDDLRRAPNAFFSFEPFPTDEIGEEEDILVDESALRGVQLSEFRKALLDEGGLSCAMG